MPIVTGVAPGAGTLVPLYNDPPSTFWSSVTGTAGTGTGKIDTIIIANPSDGPGPSVNSAYTTAINNAKAAGAKVVGYILSGWGANTAASMNADVDKWYSFYPQIDGIFIDEMDNTSTNVAKYTTLYNYIKGKSSTALVVGNPGTTTIEGYLAAADILVVAESDPNAVLSLTQPAWVANYPASRFAYLAYAASQTQMTQIVARAKAQNAAYVFATSDVLPNPWDVLPTYWTAEVAAIEANETAVVTPPPTQPPPLGDADVINIPLISGWGGTPWIRHDDMLSIVNGKIRITGTNSPSLRFTAPTVIGQKYQLSFNVQSMDPATIAANVYLFVRKGPNPVTATDPADGVWGENGPKTFEFTAGHTDVEVQIGTWNPQVDVSDIVVKALATATAGTDWEESFTGTAIDTAKWKTVWYYTTADYVRGFNNELQAYLRHGSTVENNVKAAAPGYEPHGIDANGDLVLRAIRTPTSVASQVGNAPWVSGMINSQGIKTFQYGYLEAEIQLPNVSGTLPAFWLLRANEETSDEVDIMEVVGSELTTHYFTVHDYSSGSLVSTSRSKTLTTLGSGFHTFGLDWNTSTMQAYLDRQPVGGTVTTPAGMKNPFYVIVTMAVGGDWPGNPPTNVSDISMKVRRISHWAAKPF